MNAIAVIVCALWVVAEAAGVRDDASGPCGENVTWQYDQNAAELTISGEGVMGNYNDNNPAPWNSRMKSIKSVVINNGVTSIGNFAFNRASNLISLSIPGSVTIIGDFAFYGASNLTSLTLKEGLISIGRYAFNHCESLTSVTIPSSVASFGVSPFGHCYKLTSINVDLCKR